MVEATHHEQHMFWEKYHYQPRENEPVVREWKEESQGRMPTIGYIGKRPICVCIFYAKLNGKRVAFYEGVSQLVDHEMIDKWLKHFTLDTIRCDNGTRWAHCDAWNFYHCLDAIGVLDEYRESKKKK